MIGVRLGRVAGFEIRVDWSVLVILWLFTWSLASTLPRAAPGHPALLYWAVAAAGAVVLLGSLLAHELTHAVVARRAGVAVHDVTLWLFGGMTRLGGEPRTPRAAFRIAVSGPLTSLTLAALFALAAAALTAAGAAALPVAVAVWLCAVNLVLGLFNLLPGAPLDGGRVLGAVLWHRLGDPVRAGLLAARAGRVLAFGLIALGLVAFLTGAWLAGVWTVFVGWFILLASRGEENMIATRDAVAAVRVADVMTSAPHTAPADLTVADFVERYLLGQRHSAYPVADTDGRIIGLVTLDRLRTVAPGQRFATSLREVALPLSDVPVAGSQEPVNDLLQALAFRGATRALVVDGGRLTGIVTATDLNRLIEVYRIAAGGETSSAAREPRPSGLPSRCSS